MQQDESDSRVADALQIRCIQEVAFSESPLERMDSMREMVLSTRFDSDGLHRMVVLPEMWPVGFFNFDNYRAFAEQHFGLFVDLVVEAASTLRCWMFGGSAPYEANGKYFNRSLVASPTGQLHSYDKIHLFAYRSREAEILSPGTGLTMFETPLGQTALLTCFDLRFPECFRVLRQKGCHAYVVVAAWPKARVAHWKALLISRAIENQAWVVGVNGRGDDFGTDLGGQSMIIAPNGEIIESLGDARDNLSKSLDVALTDSVRAEFPFHSSVLPTLLNASGSFPVRTSS